MTSLDHHSWDFRKGELLLVDKPTDWTSFDVVHKVRNLFGVRPVGHAGTLDPKATGLLIVCTGAMTKQIPLYVDAEKEYVGTLRLGIRTPSFDTETDVVEERDYLHVTNSLLCEAAKCFEGDQRQQPPMYSAVKVAGKPLYKYARKGRVMPRSDRLIRIESFEITAVNLPDASFRIVCSKGTYVRALINDLGERLQCGGTLTSLRRTRIGAMHVENAFTIPQLVQLRDEVRFAARGTHEDCIPA